MSESPEDTPENSTDQSPQAPLFLRRLADLDRQFEELRDRVEELRDVVHQGRRIDRGVAIRLIDATLNKPDERLVSELIDIRAGIAANSLDSQDYRIEENYEEIEQRRFSQRNEFGIDEGAQLKSEKETEREQTIKFLTIPLAFIGLIAGVAAIMQAWSNWVATWTLAGAGATSGSLMDFIIPHAYAAGVGGVAKIAYSPQIKAFIVLSMFVTVLLFFVWCLGVVMFSKQAQNRAFAFDGLKMLVSFYIGTLTVYLA